MVRMIVSGGQSGVDRAALDVALELGIPCGGWCPAGRRAEDGPIPDRYPLRETPSADDTVRTTWNVFDAEATLILAAGALTGGTRLTALTASRFARPLLHLDPWTADPASLREWLSGFPEAPILDVAGPRESGAPGIAERARVFLREALATAAAREPRTAPGPRPALVTGAGGLLGGAVMRLAPPVWHAQGTIRTRPGGPRCHRLDLADRAAVDALFDRLRPELVIHTAYSSEPGAGERDILAATVNVADAAARSAAHLIHLSTDHVLDGENAPYAESAVFAPVSEYGRWKAEAEAYLSASAPSASIVRTSLITSFDLPDPRTEWVLAALRGEAAATLFVDELRTPILLDDLARQLWELAKVPPARRAGVWHLAGPEALSRYALGVLTAAAAGFDPSPLRAGRVADSGTPRPRDLRLLTARADRELLTRPRPISAAVPTTPRRTEFEG